MKNQGFFNISNRDTPNYISQIYSDLVQARDTIFPSINPEKFSQIISSSSSNPSLLLGVISLLFSANDPNFISNISDTIITNSQFEILLIPKFSDIISKCSYYLSDNALNNLMIFLKKLIEQDLPNTDIFIECLLNSFLFNHHNKWLSKIILLITSTKPFSSIYAHHQQLEINLTYRFLCFFQIFHWMTSLQMVTTQNYDESYSQTLEALCKTIPDLLQSNLIQSEIGREMLRFTSEQYIVNKFSIKFNPTSLTNHCSTRFANYFLPQLVRNNIAKLYSDQKALLTFEYSPYFAFEIIRFVLNESQLNPSTKASVIQRVIQNHPNKDSFQIFLSLSIDLITFNSSLTDDLNRVRSVFESIRLIDDQEFTSSFYYFLEKLSKKYPELQGNLSQAFSSCNIEYPFKIVVLQSQPKTVTKSKEELISIFNETINQSKWQPKRKNEVFEKTISNLEDFFSNSHFDICETPPEAFSILLMTNNLEFISVAALKDVELLKHALYYFGKKSNNSIILKDFLPLVTSQGPKSCELLVEAFSTILVILPDLIPIFAEHLPKISKKINSPSYVKFLCFDCSPSELSSLLKYPIFPIDVKIATSLIHNQITWPEICRISFWSVVTSALTVKEYIPVIVNSICASLPALSKSVFNMNLLQLNIQRINPTKNITPILFELMNNSIHNTTIKIIKAWEVGYPDQVKQLIISHHDAFLKFYQSLGPLQSELPSNIISIICRQ